MRKYDPNNEEDVADARIDERLRTQTFDLALKEILQLKSGRFVIWQWLKRCGLYETSLHPSGSQVYANEGRRQVGLWMLADLSLADPDMFFQMMKENKQEQ